MPMCRKCKFICTGYFPGQRICADCYWDEDAERKEKLLNESRWTFNKLYSGRIQLLNKTSEEGVHTASSEVKRRFEK